MPPDFAAMIREVGRGRHGVRDLDRATARTLFDAMLDDTVPELELGALTIAFRIKGEALPEMLGFLDALVQHAARLELPGDALRPVVLPTYNGARKAPNLTALVALMLRRFGIPVLLHGLGDDARDADADDDGDDGGANPRDEGKGAADAAAPLPGTATFGRVTTLAVFRELGYAPATSLAQAQAQLARERIAYVPIDVLAPGLARLLARRTRLGVRSSAHTLAKLVDPFGGAGLRVVAVTHPDYLERMREVVVASGANALLMRGTEGEPYANPRRQPRIERFERGVATLAVEAEERSEALPALPAGTDAVRTALWIEQALDGAVPVPLPIVNQIACCLP